MNIPNNTETKNAVTIGSSNGPSAHGWHKLEYIYHCEKKYQLANVRGLHIPMDVTPDHFAVGLLHHAMRARWFANQFRTDDDSWQSIYMAAKAAANEAPAPITAEAQTKALELFQAYMAHYQGLPRPNPVACEYLVQSKLHGSDPEALQFSARLDDVSYYPEAGNKLCVGESKTCSDINQCIEEYTLHGQPLLQAALWEVAPQGASAHGSIAGIMLDIVRKPQERKTKKGTVTVSKPAFTRVFMPIARSVLDWHVDNLRRFKRRAQQITWDTLTERNITSCTRMYGRMRVPCQFRQLCQFGRTALALYNLADGNPATEWSPEYDAQKEPWE